MLDLAARDDGGRRPDRVRPRLAPVAEVAAGSARSSTRPRTGSRRPRAAAPEGEELDLVPVVVKPGGGSFHHGLTWHGSAPNTNASVARMALVTHMLPVEARFHETNVDLIYSRYRRHGDLSLDESFFPVLWDESGYRTPWLAGLPDLD